MASTIGDSLGIELNSDNGASARRQQHGNSISCTATDIAAGSSYRKEFGNPVVDSQMAHEPVLLDLDIGDGALTGQCQWSWLHPRAQIAPSGGEASLIGVKKPCAGADQSTTSAVQPMDSIGAVQAPWSMRRVMAQLNQKSPALTEGLGSFNHHEIRLSAEQARLDTPATGKGDDTACLRQPTIARDLPGDGPGQSRAAQQYLTTFGR